jgi:hypothetical protein
MRTNHFLHRALPAALLLCASTTRAAPTAAQAAKPGQTAPAPVTAAPAKPAPAAPAAASAPAPARAPAPAKSSPATSPLRSAQDKLGSNDPGTVRAATEQLAELGGDAAATAVSERLRRGLPPQLIEPAIAALERIGKPSVGPVLLELALHRRPQVRRRAIEAIGALRIRSAQSALLYALDDPSGEVRNASVLALSRVGDARALPALFAASERGLSHALIAIGQMATPKDVKAIVQRAKDSDITRIKPALQTMLDRQDFPISGKLALVNALAGLGPEQARNHFVQWLDALKTEGDPRLRKALLDAIARLDRATPAAKTAATPVAAKTGKAVAAPVAAPAPAKPASPNTTAAPAAAKPAPAKPANGVAPAAAPEVATATPLSHGAKP